MARDFRRPERRQSFLLPPDMQDWLPQDEPKATPRARYIVEGRQKEGVVLPRLMEPLPLEWAQQHGSP
jgi:hypothetical protein